MGRDHVTHETTTVSGVTDFAALEEKWRDLEARSDCSFFQSWTWTGCLVEERFPDPVLVEARESGRTVALALFNRRGRTLHLGESGDPALDGVYIEFNGVLAETGREAALTALCLRAARTRSGAWLPGARPRLVLGGVTASTEAAAAEAGFVRRNRSLSAPFIGLTRAETCFLDSRSANTRQQLRRSNRGYAAIGGIAIEPAQTLTRANEFLDGLMVLHQASWKARGKPGAFASPFFARFHRTLIARGLPLGEIDLLRVAAGTQTIGFLYNFHYRDRSLAYQSGFDYAGAGRQGKPGLTCHYEAIRLAARSGAVRYDFLAGDDRYKRSLSDGAETLHWIEVASRWSPRFMLRRAADFVIPGRRLRSGGANPPESAKS
jgi:CelD/BcsL family acetyltransferase involved in cellulose biosynthesis